MASPVGDEELAERSAEPMGSFLHDSCALMDHKVRKLVRRKGMAGYGMWWALCEVLARTHGHAVEVADDESWEVLADDLLCGVDECRSLVAELARVGLVSADELAGKGVRGVPCIVSRRMMRNAAAVGRKRVAGAKGGRPRKKAQE